MSVVDVTQVLKPAQRALHKLPEAVAKAPVELRFGHEHVNDYDTAVVAGDWRRLAAVAREGVRSTDRAITSLGKIPPLLGPVYDAAAALGSVDMGSAGRLAERPDWRRFRRDVHAGMLAGGAHRRDADRFVRQLGNLSGTLPVWQRDLREAAATGGNQAVAAVRSQLRVRAGAVFADAVSRLNSAKPAPDLPASLAADVATARKSLDQRRRELHRALRGKEAGREAADQLAATADQVLSSTVVSAAATVAQVRAGKDGARLRTLAVDIADLLRDAQHGAVTGRYVSWLVACGAAHPGVVELVDAARSLPAAGRSASRAVPLSKPVRCRQGTR